MADRRMFSLPLVNSDMFLDMPKSAQLLYFHLSMRADDDGFVGNPKRVCAAVGTSGKDYKTLLEKRFVIAFATGVCAIRHWKIHNYIQKDRYRATLYKAEKALLTADERGVYNLDPCGVQENNEPACSLYTQVRLGKERLDKVRLEDTQTEDGAYAAACAPAPAPGVKTDGPSEANKTRRRHGPYENVLLTDGQLQELAKECPDDYAQRIDRLSEYMASTGKVYKNHLATMRNWAKRDAEKARAAPAWQAAKRNPFDVLAEQEGRV